MNARRAPDEQLGGTAQTKFLDLVGAKCRDADFSDPNREMGDSVNFPELFGPLVDGPVVPIQGKAVNGNHVHVVQSTKVP